MKVMLWDYCSNTFFLQNLLLVTADCHLLPESWHLLCFWKLANVCRSSWAVFPFRTTGQVCEMHIWFSVSVTDIPDVGPNGKPFSCDKCHSPFIVNPARSHRLHSRRKYRPRKITDLVTKQVLLLCNACGLSMVRSKKERHKKVCSQTTVDLGFSVFFQWTS